MSPSKDHEAAAGDLFAAIENADHHASNADCRAAGEDLSQACPLAEAHKIRAIVLIAAALSEAVRVVVEARDKKWCYAHGWREGAFDADGKPFTPERHAEIMQESIKAASEGVEEAVRVALVEERKTSAEMLQHQADGFELRLRVALSDAREALQFYGRHTRGESDGCGWLKDGPCTCGLEAAIIAAGWTPDAQATPAPEPECNNGKANAAYYACPACNVCHA